MCVLRVMLVCVCAKCDVGVCVCAKCDVGVCASLWLGDCVNMCVDLIF